MCVVTCIFPEWSLRWFVIKNSKNQTYFLAGLSWAELSVGDAMFLIPFPLYC